MALYPDLQDAVRPCLLIQGYLAKAFVILLAVGLYYVMRFFCELHCA